MIPLYNLPFFVSPNSCLDLCFFANTFSLKDCETLFALATQSNFLKSYSNAYIRFKSLIRKYIFYTFFQKKFKTFEMEHKKRF